MTLSALLLAVSITVAPSSPAPDMPVGVAADTLRGRVTDAGGKAVRGARVTVTDLSAAATTAADGSFALVVPAGTYTVLVESPGQATLSRMITVPVRDLDLMLQALTFRLEPVNVTATRSPSALSSSSLPVSILW